MAKHDLEIKVGIFVTLGTALTMFAILLLGGADSIFKRSVSYSLHFPAVDGLIVGAKVVIGGLTIGAVSDFELDEQSKNIKVTLKVEKKFENWIREDSMAEMLTQGVLGDKYLSITSGTPDKPQVKDGAEIPVRPTKDISQFLTKGDQLMVNLNGIASSLDRILKSFEAANRSDKTFEGLAQTAKNLASATHKLDNSTLKNLNGILEKINSGTGTLGALINDPSLYYDARALLGGANRNRIVRNLVRQTIKDGEDGAAAAAAANEPAPKKSKRP
ncbi:MAG: MCE family protein [Bdellovibrionales bacterium]|nr:MCE family protein [Bdellovibrionales bacterium]